MKGQMQISQTNLLGHLRNCQATNIKTVQTYQNFNKRYNMMNRSITSFKYQKPEIKRFEQEQKFKVKKNGASSCKHDN